MVGYLVEGGAGHHGGMTSILYTWTNKKTSIGRTRNVFGEEEALGHQALEILPML
jgi:hypothetical protein